MAFALQTVVIATALLAQVLPTPPAEIPHMVLQLTGTSDASRMLDVDAHRAGCTTKRVREAQLVLTLVLDAVRNRRAAVSDEVRVIPVPSAPETFHIQFLVPAVIPAASPQAIDESSGVFATARAFASCAYITTLREPAATATGSQRYRSGFYFIPARGIVYRDVAGAPSKVFRLP